MNFEDIKIKLTEDKKKKLDKTLKIIVYSVFTLSLLAFIYFVIWGTK